jgi:hypothetical protein
MCGDVLCDFGEVKMFLIYIFSSKRASMFAVLELFLCIIFVPFK